MESIGPCSVNNDRYFNDLLQGHGLINQISGLKN
jgi:hypothetical protein